MVAAPTIAAIRFGYGLRPGEAPPSGAQVLLDGLVRAAHEPVLFPVPGSAARRARLDQMIAARKAGASAAELTRLRHEMRRETAANTTALLLQRALGASMLFERLVAFWADHFTVAARNPGQAHAMGAYEAEAVRPHVATTFGDMLVAVARHPAMLNYLDQVSSVGPGSPAGRKRGLGLNENLAREVLELHTLGAGGPYRQGDVRELAELLTGWSSRKGFLEFRFDASRAEPGAETVLGRRYGGGRPGPADAEALLHDLARHPATARHLARKLAAHFIADAPDEGLVEHIAAAWERTGGALPAVHAALIEHPVAWQGFGAKVKQPQELVVSTLRAGGVDLAAAQAMLADEPAVLHGALQRLGQPFFGAPGPDGWPEAAADWITPQGLAARLTFATEAGERLARRGADPRAFAAAALGDALRPDTAFAAGAAAERWEGVALVLASPEFNRR